MRAGPPAEKITQEFPPATLRWLFVATLPNFFRLSPMKKSSLFLLSLLLALLPAVVRAEDAKPKKADTELEKSMDLMNKPWRKLRKQAADQALNADSLALLATIKAAAQDNLKYTPDLARDVPAEKRDKFIAGYQEQMKKFIASLDPIEAAFKAGDNPAAVGFIAKAAALQKEGHKEYKRPE